MVKKGPHPLCRSTDNLVTKYRRELATLPPPGEEYRRSDIMDDDSVTVDKSLFRRATDRGLVESVGRVYTNGSRTHLWSTTRKLWDGLEFHGALEDGEPALDCGDGGPLDCGSEAFITEGDILVCQHCDGETPVERAKDRIAVGGEVRE